MVQLASTLLALGVFCLSTAKRLEVAARLQSLTVGNQQLLDLDSYIRESEPDVGKSRRYLAALLGDDAKLRDALGGLAAYLRKKPKAADAGPPHVPNLPLGATGCRCRHCEAFRAASPTSEPVWSHDEMCVRAKCLHDGDRWSLPRIAQFLGVSESTAQVMVERGRAQTTVPVVPRNGFAKAAAKDDAAEKERREQFRAMVREGKLA